MKYEQIKNILITTGYIQQDYKQEILNYINLLQQENKILKEKLDKYENPEDMTLMMMWCTEKVKDENQELKKQLENKYKKVGTLTNEILYEENTKLVDENKQLKDNWDTLKVYLITRYNYGIESISYRDVFLEIREMMQELEIQQELERRKDTEE